VIHAPSPRSSVPREYQWARKGRGVRQNSETARKGRPAP